MCIIYYIHHIVYEPQRYSKKTEIIQYEYQLQRKVAVQAKLYLPSINKRLTKKKLAAEVGNKW